MTCQAYESNPFPRTGRIAWNIEPGSYKRRRTMPLEGCVVGRAARKQSLCTPHYITCLDTVIPVCYVTTTMVVLKIIIFSTLLCYHLTIVKTELVQKLL